MALRAFAKPALPVSDLVQFLIRKGLDVPDLAYAEHCMAYIGYYRLKIYTRPFEDPGKRFTPGVTFDEILELYEFDRRLRLLCLDAIERVEVALRAQIVNEMGVAGTPHFYYREDFFQNKAAVTNIRLLGQKAKHLSVTHYKAQYSSPSLPPIWCLTEASTFGDLSTLYADLSLVYRKRIARAFGLDETVCVSWFRSIAYLRNVCAHHNRLWNADLLVNTPKKAKSYAADLSVNTRCYARLVVLKALLKAIDHNGLHNWGGDLNALIGARPRIATLNDMGFPQDWGNRPLWS